MNQERLDLRLARAGLAESRERAQRLIRAGQVQVNGRTETKPSLMVATEAQVAVAAAERFVSRGGEKLEAAWLQFQPDVAGRVCLDVGASTGGFTDCLLQHGAARVYCVDVGRGQLHWRLRQDARVVVLDGVNARYLQPAQLPERPTFAVADVSFISLTMVLPAVRDVLRSPGGVIALVKPQFEAGRSQVGPGGVVRDEAVRAAVVERVRRFGETELGWRCVGVCPSPLPGPAGNREFLVYWQTVTA